MFPSSYQNNTRHENEILKLADNFHRQFNYLYPDRIKPPLYLENECKVSKIICTTLCPLKVKMPTKMKAVHYCANFVAEYFDYEILSSPLDCPKRLFSVESILKRKSGNSLDLSTVLCTLLLASNFDAYVVQGYARKSICEKFMSKVLKPPIKFYTDSEYHKRFFTGSKSTLKNNHHEAENKYEIKFDLLKSFWLQGKSMFQRIEEPEPEIPREEFEEQDIYLGKRIHFWVLVLTYESGSLDCSFIEPTTGEKKCIDDLDYLGIEFVWNNKNFWCNNQASELNYKNIEFDLDNAALWQPFLPEFKINVDYDKPIKMPETWVKDIEITEDNLRNIFPETWVKDIEITEDNLRNIFPENGREFHYKMADVKKYNSKSSRDGLVYHVTYYKTEQKEEKEITHAFFSDRKDCLEYRKIDFENKQITDVFDLGRDDSLQEHKYPLNGLDCFPQELKFYSHLRQDKLKIRIWADNMTHDEFTNRSDHLIARKVILFQEGRTDLIENDNGYSKAKTSTTVDDSKNIKVSETTTNTVKSKTFENNYPSKEKIDYVDAKLKLKDKEIIEVVTESKQNVNVDVEELPEEAESIKMPFTEITPSSFDADNVLFFKDVDFSTWELESFLNSIDPAERYATSESESEDEKYECKLEEHLRSSDRHLFTDTNEEGKKEKKVLHSEKGKDDDFQENDIHDSQDDNIKKNYIHDSQDGEIQEDLEANQLEEDDDNDEKARINESTKNLHEHGIEKSDVDNKLDDYLSHESKIRKSVREFDREIEIYDEINFDALSDEELEIDYQLFLSKLLKEYKLIKDDELFYTKYQFKKYKDLHSRDTLKLKKRIIRKRRNNIRSMQRVETGKPKVRIHKRKNSNDSERNKGIYADEFIDSLNLKDSLKIKYTDEFKDFYELDALEKPYIDAVNAEIIQKEGLMLLDKKLKDNNSRASPRNSTNIQCIKNTYQRDLSLPVEHDIENIWFNYETDNYRLDFHYLPDKSSRKILIFSKPESGNTDFHFSNSMCRQILPTYETKLMKSSQLYLYLVNLLKKEPLERSNYERFQNEMKGILQARFKEEERSFKIEEKILAKELEQEKSASQELVKIKDALTNENDIISYTIETLKLSLPLSEYEAKTVYATIFYDFCLQAVVKLFHLENEYNKSTNTFENFLGKCKNWDKLTDEREKEFTEACAIFSAEMSRIRLRSDAQRTETKTNFNNLKKKLFNDSRLQVFVNKVCENQNEN